MPTPGPDHAAALLGVAERPQPLPRGRVHREYRADLFDKALVDAASESEQKLGLTKIHNQLENGELPALGAAWDELNEAVNACYGFPSGTWRSERETLELLLGLNHHVADLQ